MHQITREQVQDSGRLLDTPALRPPPGITPNFENPPNRSSLGYGLSIFGLVITTIFAFIRAYSRAFILKRVKLEDVLAFCAYGLSVCHVWVFIGTTQNPGWYVHQWDLRIRGLNKFLWWLHLSTNLYGCIILCLKVAILLEWLRIFVPRGTRNAFFWTSHVVLWLNVAMYVTSIIITNVRCTPYEKSWNVTLKGNCIDTKAVFVVLASLNLVSDLVILILPQRVVWKLQMSRRQKIGASLVFAVGIITCVSACMRIVTSREYVVSDDITYTQSQIGVWVEVEIIGLLLVICIPATPKAFSKFAMPHGITGTLRSWVSLLNRSSATTGRDNSSIQLQSGLPGRKAAGGSYANISRERLPMSRLPSASSSELRAAEPKPLVHGDGILRVQEFSRGEEPGDRTSLTDVHQRQHTWEAFR